MVSNQTHSHRQRAVGRLLLVVGVFCGLCLVGAETTLAETQSEEPVELAGNGTAEDPYLVTAVAEWNEIPDNADGHYMLASDITASGVSRDGGTDTLQTIGSSTEIQQSFNGILDGQDHTIEIQKVSNVGHLVPVNNGTIRNLRVEIEEWEYIYLPHRHPVAVVAGVNTGTIRDVTVADVTIDLPVDDVAGLVGENRGRIVGGEARNMTFRAGGASGIAAINRDGSIVGSSVVNSTFDAANASGIVGQNRNGTIAGNSLVDSRIEWSNNAGGIVGHNHDGAVVRSRLVRSTFGEGIENAGGVVARDQSGTISGVTVDGTIRGANVGGVVGYADGTAILNATVRGVVSGEIRGEFTGGTGGIVGTAADAWIERTKTTARITGNTAGGVTGLASGTIVSEAIVAGPVDGIASGSVIGRAVAGDQNVLTAVYYDRNRTGQSRGAGNRETAAIGLNTGEMVGQSAGDTMAALDFDNFWLLTDGYPTVRGDSDAQLQDTVAVRSATLTDSVVVRGNRATLVVVVENRRPEQTVYQPNLTVGGRPVTTEPIILLPREQRTLTLAWNVTETGSVPVRVDSIESATLIAVSEPTPTVTRIASPDRVAVDSPYAVTATLENVADTALNTTVTYASGVQTRSRTVSVDPGETTVAFTVVGDQTGEETHMVSVRDKSLTTTTAIRKPASLGVSRIVAPESVEAGERFTVKATIENTGGLETTVPVTIEAGGQTLGQREVSFAPGETTVEMTHAIEDSGPTELRVSTPSQQAIVQITVEGEGSGGATNSDGSGPGFGVVLAVLAAVLVATRARE